MRQLVTESLLVEQLQAAFAMKARLPPYRLRPIGEIKGMLCACVTSGLREQAQRDRDCHTTWRGILGLEPHWTR
jgi:hypothetical protein